MENTNPQTTEIEEPFGFTSITWHELPRKKLNHQRLEALLNTHLDLSNYGNGLSKLVFGFIAYPKEDREDALEREEREFLPDRKLASIGWIIDYEKLMTATEEEAYIIMKQTYLEGVKAVLPTLVTADFEVERFCKDLEEVLFNK